MKWIRLCEFGVIALGAVACTSHENPGPVDARNQQPSSAEGRGAEGTSATEHDSALPGASDGHHDGGGSSASQGQTQSSTVEAGGGTSADKNGSDGANHAQGTGSNKGPGSSASGPSASPSAAPVAPMSDADVKSRLDRADARIQDATAKLAKAKPEARTRASELLKKAKDERAAIEKNRTAPAKKPAVDAVDVSASIMVLERDLDDLEATLKP
jgi:hypothetical protein